MTLLYRIGRKSMVSLLVTLFLVAAVFAATANAQTGTGSLRGQVVDPSGAVVANATVLVLPAQGAAITATTNKDGGFDVKTLLPGKYTVQVFATGFAQFEAKDVAITAGSAAVLNVHLSIEVQKEKVEVSETSTQLDTSSEANANSITIKGKDLEALSDDPDEMQDELTALAGPSAGPNGGQMYIDGFTAGQLPPKSSIREIRINQNPFSAEYDQLGYGRIEVFTKPGTDQFHGQFFASGNDSTFNTPNPFAGSEPPYYSTQYNGNLGGPLGKSASFFFNIERRNINELAAINTPYFDPSNPDNTQIIESVPNPRQRTNISPRFDWAVNKNNTLTARYQYWRDTETNNGIGVFSLPTLAYYSKEIEHTVQISDTQVFGAKVVNETRFQYVRDNSYQDPVDTNPTVNVLGNFVGGGNSTGLYNDNENRYELQNYTSIVKGNHMVKFGGRFRATQDNNSSVSGFNGTFTFSALNETTDSNGNVIGGTPSNCATLGGNPACPLAYAYAAQQIHNNGGGTAYATQLTYTLGQPSSVVNYYDGGLYIQDDWRVLPNFTLSSGLRFETQNAIHDKGDWGPRLGFAWGVKGRSSPPIVVIRGGYGIFYDRFQVQQLLELERLNGTVQQQYIINNPTCFPGVDVALTNFSNCGPVGTSGSNTNQLTPPMHAPYNFQGRVSVERQVTKSATVSATYLNSRGFDQLVTINASAPYPGTPCGVGGLPACAPIVGGNVFRYVSEGNFKQNQLIVNTNVRIGSKVQMFGFYTLGYANSDTAGLGASGGSGSGSSSFPSNSYNISQDWGRGSFDIRNRLFLGGSIALPYLIRFNPFMVVSSGAPYNLTSPIDINGDQIYNDRPSLDSHTACPLGTAPNGSTYCTTLGTFDATGVTGTPLPINYATGPAHFVMNLRLSKTFGFGPKANAGPRGGGPGGGPGGGGHGHGPLFGGGGPMVMSASSDQRYNLTFAVGVRNLFNNVNVSNPNGILGSRFFNVSNSLQGGPFSPGTAANRRLELQATFNF